jgi:hypothetical protein
VRVNVIGAAPGWRDAPEDKGENWGVNNTHLFEKRIDLIVDVHNRFNPKKLREEKKDLFHVGALTYKEIPAYFQREVEGFPTIKKYPRDEIIKKFGVDYFGSGIDYIIALALYKGATEIHLYGVWMVLDSEYTHQKPSVEFWVGFAMGRGVKVRVHGQRSSILKTRNGLMYGYQDHQAWVKKYLPNAVSLSELEERYE